jgi:hypothetical protein
MVFVKQSRRIRLILQVPDGSYADFVEALRSDAEASTDLRFAELPRGIVKTIDRWGLEACSCVNIELMSPTFTNEFQGRDC